MNLIQMAGRSMTQDAIQKSSKDEERNLIPYPETKVHWVGKARGAFAIRTPWISVSAHVDEGDIASIQDAIDAINNGARSPREGLIVNYFLRQFAEHPVSYTQPRNLKDYRNSGPILVRQDRDEVLKLPEGLTEQLVWDHAQVLKDSRVDGSNSFDAVSVVGLMRRLRLLATSSNTKIQDQVADLATLKEHDPTLFVQVMKRVLEHSWFVTKSAVPTLKASLGLNGNTDQILKNFILSETGHDLLVHKSLKALGGVREDWTAHLYDEVKSLIEILRYAASHSLLSLAALIEGFEGVKYDTEPNNLWKLLDNIPGYPNASVGVREHQKINDQHQHANICIELASALPPVTADEVGLALQLAEVSELLRKNLFEKLYSSIGLL